MDNDSTPIKSTETTSDDVIPNSSNNLPHNIPDGCGANVTVGNEDTENAVVIPDTDDIVVINSSSDDSDILNFQIHSMSRDSRIPPESIFNLDLDGIRYGDVVQRMPVSVLSDTPSPVKDEPKVPMTTIPVNSPMLAKSPVASTSIGSAFSSPPPASTSPSYKILYVKPLTLSRSISHPSNVTTPSTSNSHVTSLNSTKQIKSENALNLLKLNYSTIRSSDSNGSESNASSERSSRGSERGSLSPSKCTKADDTTKPVEHTVNLLNNNRIVIKSVKSTGSTPPSKSNVGVEHVAATIVSTSANTSTVSKAAHTTSAEKVKSETDSVDTKDHIESNTDIVDTPNRQQQLPCTKTDQSESCATRSNCDASDNGELNDTIDDIKCDSKILQHMFEKSTDNIANDHNEHEPKPTKQIARELKQLQNDVSKSKILTEFIQDQSGPSSRRPLQGRAKQKVASLVDDTENSADAMANRVDSPALSESDRSVSSVAGTSSGKRNTRSRNMDFSAKQKRFLKDIQQVTRGTDDDSDALADDDDDDLDFHVERNMNAKSSIPTERRKSIPMPVLDINAEVTRY